MSKKSNAPGIFNTQFITSCLSISLVLILLGTVIFFVFTARNLSDYMRENINISLLLDDKMSEKAIDAFKAELEARPYVKSLEYISKEQGLETVKAEMGADPSEFLGFNPITASFELKLKSEYANNDSIQRILDEMKMTSNVVDVLYQKDLINSVNNNIKKISFIMLIIAALFTYISFALINNTVRLSIFSRTHFCHNSHCIPVFRHQVPQRARASIRCDHLQRGDGRGGALCLCFRLNHHVLLYLFLAQQVPEDEQQHPLSYLRHCLQQKD